MPAANAFWRQPVIAALSASLACTVELQLELLLLGEAAAPAALGRLASTSP